MASVPQREQLASMPKPLLPKGKEQSCLSKAPDRGVGESQGERELHLGKKGESKRERGEERVDCIMKEGRFQGGKGGKAKRASLGEVEGSMRG